MTTPRKNSTPCRINQVAAVGWEQVNPKSRLKGAGAFLAYRLNGASYDHINYGAEHIKFVEGALRALMEKRQERIVANARREQGRVEWEDTLSCFGASEQNPEDMRAMIADEVGEALNAGDDALLIRYLEYGKIDYISHELTGNSPGDAVKTLYFNINGGKITNSDREKYKTVIEDINNWLCGNKIISKTLEPKSR